MLLIPSFTLQNGMILGFGVAAHAIVLAALVPVLSRLTSDSLRYYLALAVSGLAATLIRTGDTGCFPRRILRPLAVSGLAGAELSSGFPCCARPRGRKAWTACPSTPAPPRSCSCRGRRSRRYPGTSWAPA
ncbi:MAG: hypothetical protein MZU97_12330 [Bacillus subtilis]|nr:hypothetical protein [Bacillus subtilis]